MKRISKLITELLSGKLWIILISLCMANITFADESSPVIEVKKGENKEVNLEYGEKATLVVKELNGLEWSTSAPSIVTVTDIRRKPETLLNYNLIVTDTDQGFIRGIRTGKSTVTAKDQNGNVMATFVVTIGTAISPTRPAPYFPPADIDETMIAKADQLIAGFSEKQWLVLVPTGPARGSAVSPVPGSAVNNPPGYTHWTWNVKTPNQITDIKSGVIFIHNGDGTYTIENPGKILGLDVKTLQPRIMKVKNILDEFVNVPVWDMPGNSKPRTTLVQTRIDHYKLIFTENALSTLTKAYYLTKDKNKKYEYARRCALLLDEYAKHLPHYYTTNCNNDYGGNPQDIDVMPYNSATGELGGVVGYNRFSRAATHNGFASEVREIFVVAYDMIYNTNALTDLSKQKGYDVNINIGENLFANTFYFISQYYPLLSPVNSNLKSNMQLVVKLATIMNRPDMIEWAIREIALENMAYFRRDYTCSGSFMYQGMAARNTSTLASVLNNFIQVYPDYKIKMPELTDKIGYYMDWGQKINTDSKQMAYPNGELAPAGDSGYMKTNKKDSVFSKLLPAFCYGVIGGGNKDNLTQLNFSSMAIDNHIHSDKNGFTLFAFGRELISDVRYVINGRPERRFSQCAASHNTAFSSVYNKEKKQYIHNQVRTHNTNGVLDNAGRAFNVGNLTLFQPDMNGIAVIEADASTKVEEEADQRNQRLMILNTIDAIHPYVLDFYCLEGGQKHDYLFHGATDFDQVSSAKGITLSELTGENVAEVAQQFIIENVEDADLFSSTYFKNMRAGTANDNFEVTYTDALNTNSGTRILVIGEKNAKVYVGESMVALRPGSTYELFWRPAMIVRHEDKTSPALKSTFVSVIEPLNGKAAIKEIKRLATNTEDVNHIALRVSFTNGRQDIILVNMNNPVLAGQKNAVQQFSTLDGSYTLNGRIGICSNYKNKPEAWLIAGSNFKYNNKELKRTDLIFDGKITGAQRIATGAESNALITDAILPAGDVLKGKWLSLTYGTYTVQPTAKGVYPYLADGTLVKKQNGMSEMYQIERIERKGDKTYIHTIHDHILEMAGGKATEVSNPKRTFEGYGTFQICSGTTSDAKTM